METTMYDTLLQLPLFQGLCKDDFTAIIERVRFHFLNCKKNEVLANQGELCNRLIFLLNGEISSLVVDASCGYEFSETVGAPYIIEPYSLFGMETYYTATYRARTDIKALTIDKSFVYSELNNYEIFRLNYLNILSNRIQTMHKKLWNNHIGTLEEKLLHFLQVRSQKPEGEKVLHITMEELGKIINEPRINVSKVLNEWQKQGLIQLKRKEIFIPAFEKLTKNLI